MEHGHMSLSDLDKMVSEIPDGLETNLPSGYVEKFFDPHIRTARKNRCKELRTDAEGTAARLQESLAAGEKFFDQSAGIENEWFCVSVGVYEDSGFPVMIWEDLFGRRRYLVPFRGYCFQMCADMKGNDDIASNEVIGICNIQDAAYHTNRRWGSQSNVAPDQIHKYVWLEMIYGVLYRASNRTDGIYHKPLDAFGQGCCNAMINLLEEYTSKYTKQ